MYLDIRSFLADAWRFFLFLSISRVKNYLLLHYSFRQNNTHFFARSSPASLSIETASFCNLRCPECPTGMQKLSRGKPFPDHDEYVKLIDELHKKLMTVQFFFQGEPFLNPGTEKMIHYAHQKNVYTITSTNAQNITFNRAKSIVESGLSKLIISVDGITQDVYEQYRVGGSLDKVISAVKHLNYWKKERKQQFPIITGQFIVFAHNESQLQGLKKFMRNAGFNKMEIKTAQIYNAGNKPELLPKNKRYSRYMADAVNGKIKLKRPLRNRCIKMWQSAVITVDGNILPCCYDKDSQHVLGSIHHKTFKETWQSATYQEFRKEVHTCRSKIAMCRNCGE